MLFLLRKKKLGKAQNVFKEKSIVIFENKLWYYHSKTLGIWENPQSIGDFMIMFSNRWKVLLFNRYFNKTF